MQVLKEEVKDRILTAAEKVFYEQDYRSAKLTDIAEQANIPVALIYTYFKNKEGLFDEVVAGVLDNIIKMRKRWKQEVPMKDLIGAERPNFPNC